MKKVLVAVLALAMMSMVSAAMADAFVEGFNYAGGDLIGQGGWTGNAGSQIQIVNGTAKLTYDDSKKGTFADHAVDILGSMIYFDVDVWAGGTGDQGNAFDIQVNDAAGKNFARWYGAWNTDRPRIDGTGYVLPTQTLLTNQWNKLSVQINTVAQTSTFFLNGTNLGSLAYGTAQPGIGSYVAQVRLGFQSGIAANNGSTKSYDNLYIGDTMAPVPEPGSIVALCSGLVGIVGFARRRRA